MKGASNIDKKNILIAALGERYEAMRVIRDRVQNIGVWALGIMLAASGWLVQSEVFIAPGRLLLYLLALGVVLWALRFRYLGDLQKGFSEQQRVTVRLEKALGLYMPGVFDDEADSIYPKKWEQSGRVGSDGKFFSGTYLLLYIGVVILAISLSLQSENTFLFCWFGSMFITTASGSLL